MSETECPTCGDSFDSEKGLKIHHQRTHNSPLGGANHFCDSCSSSFYDKNGLQKHYDKLPEHRKTGNECSFCENYYQDMGKHWTNSNECRPSITDKQREIITGVLMGDGSITGKDDGNPSMKVEMKNREYLKHLSNELGFLSTSVISKASDTTFSIRTVCHPELSEYSDWYSSGEKVFPEDIELTPTVLKHWYVCDGSKNISNASVNPRVILYISNEYENTDKIDYYFENSNIPTPSNYVIRERERHYNNETHISCSAQFTVNDSKKIWEYMGEPPSGFSRKWPRKT